MALFNANAADWLAASADFASVGLDPATTYIAKDLETKAITAMSDNVTVADLPAHATTVYRLSDDPPTETVPAVVNAKSVGPNGIAVDYTVTAADALGGALTPACTPASGSVFPIGPTTVSCTATDAAGRSTTKSFVVQVAPPDHPGDVGGTVPATLSLTLGSAATFGPFTPGVTQDYTATTTANVVSTAGDATLSVADPSSTATGHMVNGTFSLPSALQSEATSPGGTGGAYSALGTLLTYSGPISNDPVTVTFLQHIASTDALRTGTYAKTLTFTLSTTTP